MKRNYWPLFFIGIFSFVFSMIIWTIMSASSVPVHEDKSFIQTYQNVDDNYNEIMNSNVSFLENYDFNFYINDKKVELTTDDIKYSQRVLEKISKHKDLLIVGKNTFKISVIKKDDSQLQEIDINLVVTKSISSDKDISLTTRSFTNDNNTYLTEFNIDEENNWNITGTFKIKNDNGYIFIKTNAI